MANRSPATQTGILALLLLLAFAAPASATAQTSPDASAAVCPAGTIPVGPFCVINPLGGGSGVCPAGTIRVGPFCVIDPF